MLERQDKAWGTDDCFKIKKRNPWFRFSWQFYTLRLVNNSASAQNGSFEVVFAVFRKTGDHFIFAAVTHF